MEISPQRGLEGLLGFRRVGSELVKCWVMVERTKSQDLFFFERGKKELYPMIHDLSIIWELSSSII